MVSNPAGRPLQLQNVLAESASPYVSDFTVAVCHEPCSNHIQLRAHKDNPVAWQGWSPNTIELAKQHQRLIFLSIGFASCHCKLQMDSTVLNKTNRTPRVSCHGSRIFRFSRGGQLPQ